MIDEILGYRKTGKDTWQPIVHSKGYMYTAAVMTCGCCGNMISGMGGPGTQNTYCVSCYEKEQMKLNISAGADIHAGDGGYSEGTQEAYDEFVKNRNYQVICPKCGVDRLRVDCPNINRLDCGIKMEAQ